MGRVRRVAVESVWTDQTPGHGDDQPQFRGLRAGQRLAQAEVLSLGMQFNPHGAVWYYGISRLASCQWR